MTGAARPARVHRDGDALVFEGRLDRAAVAGLWHQLQALGGGVQRLELGSVETVDSSGLALLAELAAARPGIGVNGDPPGLSELRAAYRLGPTLDFGR